MSEQPQTPVIDEPEETAEEQLELPSPPPVDHLITEDDTPLDNPFQEKQQRMLTEPLFSSGWQPEGDRTFVAFANVGIFAVAENPAIVPDMLLSLDVKLPADIWEKGNRSYMIWLYGKPPDVVVEVVSNRRGRELARKVELYRRMRIAYYIVFDPRHQLHARTLTCHELQGLNYVECSADMIKPVGLGLRLWEGTYEDMEATWLRWCDREGNLIPTGGELGKQALQEHQRAEEERQRAEEEHQRAEEEHQRAERLAARLREMGIDPDKMND